MKVIQAPPAPAALPAPRSPLASPAMASPISGHHATSTGSISTMLNPDHAVTGARGTTGGNAMGLARSSTGARFLVVPFRSCP